jgi:hypothetical protein
MVENGEGGQRGQKQSVRIKHRAREELVWLQLAEQGVL